MNHFLQQIEAALLPTANQFAPDGSDPKAIAHQWIHAIANGIKDLVKSMRVGMARAYLPYLAKGKIKAFEYAFAICKSSLCRV